MRATNKNTKGNEMDLIKKQLAKITIGNVTSMFDIVVWRKGNDSFVVGCTINIKSTGLRIDAAAQRIYDLSREY